MFQLFIIVMCSAFCIKNKLNTTHYFASIITSRYIFLPNVKNMVSKKRPSKMGIITGKRHVLYMNKSDLEVIVIKVNFTDSKYAKLSEYSGNTLLVTLDQESRTAYKNVDGNTEKKYNSRLRSSF